MQAVIFDLDGVLLRSEPLWRQGFADTANGFLRGRGLPDPGLTPADMRRFEGGRVNDTLRTVLDELGQVADPATLARLTDAVVAQVSAAVDHDRDAIGPSVAVARALAARGVRLAVASSSAQAFIDAAVRELGLAGTVEVTESALLLEHGKPHPEVYRGTLARLGLDAAECLAVEDSATGVVAALRAGLDCVWLRDGDPEQARREARALLADVGGGEVTGRVRAVTPVLRCSDVGSMPGSR